MAFNPNEPQNGETVDADVLRDQFNSLNDKIDAVPTGPAGPPGPQGQNGAGAKKTSHGFSRLSRMAGAGQKASRKPGTARAAPRRTRPAPTAPPQQQIGRKYAGLIHVSDGWQTT